MTGLGVGLTHVPGAEPILEACADLLEVVEIEPQALWRARPDGTTGCDEEALRRLADLPGARLLHGVGNPVGGCRPPDPRHTALVGELAGRLRAPWVSEHLAFNHTGRGDEGFRTGFMLPPRQTPEGVRRSVASVRAMADAVPVPLAVEIGANYLRPRADELSDGRFAAGVAEGAGCGLLLDLHNVLANERNGRAPVARLLDELPLDRVWEVHLAGGFEHRGYWLDAHSGLPDEELLALAERVLPRLPALRAVLFEVTGSAVPGLDPQAVRDLLVRVREQWRPQEPMAPVPRERPAAGAPPAGPDTGPGPEEWEHVLGALTIGRVVDSPFARELAADPAVALLRELVTESRASALAGTLVHTVRLLLLTLGEAGVRDLLDDYTRSHPPELFATDEAAAFAGHLRRTRPRVPWLADVLELDLGLVRVRLDDTPRTVRLGTDPNDLLAALGAGRLPVDPGRGSFLVRLTA
ncbi:DUF692 family multinuclear iron-containing protein [Streptomyces sp. CB01881]|uniref:DUF692 domain-containing protein n=1 Tax=Streptomyces sp. CB01881 TaxID=2078691 RepID=UPI000CDC421C|nr:DUF692 family multinuclear iron-containing protein [Streptomyces sp. CB01881]AUY52840.1 hypothetical protein C2142_32450 [Streptomyces sp. CB01881]TYC70558.1 DUF692 family protein [Streptomyces sp. CB01881]